MKTILPTIFLFIVFICIAVFAGPNGPGLPVTQNRKDYSAGSVTTAAWVQLIASTPNQTSFIQIFDSSGETMQLGVGAPGSEVVQMIIPPGGNDYTPLYIPFHARISIRAVSGNAISGENDISLFY